MEAHLTCICRDICQYLFKTLRDKTITLFVKSVEKVENVKAKIQERTGIPSDQQQLMFAGMQLDNNKTFAEYHFDTSRGLTVYLELKDGMQIFVQILTGSDVLFEGITTTLFGMQMSLRVSNRMSIAQIMSLIEYQMGIPRYLQTLLFRSMKLESDKCLDDYGIQENSRLYLIIEVSDRVKLEIEIRTSFGKYCVQVSSQSTVREIRRKSTIMALKDTPLISSISLAVVCCWKMTKYFKNT